MRRMCRNVSEASERIRLEMEKLHRDEEAVRKQEDRLLHTIEQLERKETQFRDKGMPCSILALRTWCADAIAPDSHFGARRNQTRRPPLRQETRHPRAMICVIYLVLSLSIPGRRVTCFLRYR